MFNTKKKYTLLDFKKYIYLILTTNFLSILLLNDTTSFNLGLLSLQSLIYCINTYLFLFFVIFESISAYLDFYGLTFNFLYLVINNFENLNLKFNTFIFLTNLNYFLFLILNLFFFYNRNKILKILKLIIIKKKKIFLITIISFLIVIYLISKINFPSTLKNFTNKTLNKIISTSKGNILRNDNWYNVLINTSNYSHKKKFFSDFNFEKKFQNFKDLNNIYIVINESYPNFKNKKIKDELYSVLKSNLKNIDIKEFKKNWSKDYSTTGAEKELFCDEKGTWKEFNKNFNNFLIKNDCWINIFFDRQNIFIHSFNKESFNRSRYYTGDTSFFNEVYFKKDLLKLGYSICDKNMYYKGVCENELINNFLPKLSKGDNKKLIIFLTVENHIPVKIDNQINLACKNFPLNLNPQFCQLYKNQLKFNFELNNFINQLDDNDLLVFFSDTPPLLSIRDRIHFEDYIDVFFFKKEE